MRTTAWISVACTWLILLFWASSGWIGSSAQIMVWLAWIPATAWLVAAVPALILSEAMASLVSPRPRLVFVLAVIPIIVLLGASFAYDWRIPIPLPEKGENQVRIAFINASHPTKWVEPAAAKKLLALDAEVTLITDAGGLYGALKNLIDNQEDAPRLAGTFRVSVLSRLPILRISAELATRDIVGVVVEIELANEGQLRILVVDLPSNSKKPRTELAAALRAFIEGDAKGGFDLIVGDFNMTPGSAALNLVKGESRNVFEVAGSGWGGTWPNAQPVLRLDHGFVTSNIRVIDARTFNIGVAHRGLLMTLELEPAIPVAGAEEPGDTSGGKGTPSG